MKIRWAWLVAAAVAALIVLAILAAPMADLILTLEQYLPGWGAAGLVLYACIYAAAPLLMLPTLPLGLGAGIIFSFWRGLLTVTLGSILTASAGFLLARSLFRHRIERKIRRNPRFAAIDRMVARDGWKIVGMLRLTWLHCGFSNYAFGLSAIPFRQYILISAATQVPGNVISVYLGTVGMVGYEVLTGVDRERTTLEYAMWGVGAVIALAAGILIATKAKRAVERGL